MQFNIHEKAKNMTTTARSAIVVYTESTPNPETLKFVSNKMLLHNDHLEFADEASARHSDLASELFAFPFVRGVFIADNFVTITKSEEAEWYEIIPPLRDFIREFLSENKPIIDMEWYRKLRLDSGEGEDSDDETRIKEILDKYIKPAVQMDGGAIVFESYENGIVKLQLKGACSGCPSSMITLKAGIEGLLKRMMPQIEGVEAIEA